MPLEQIAAETQGNFEIGNWRDFGHGARFDYQRMRTDDGRTLFMRDFTAYSNIAIGYSYAANGATWQDAATSANVYAFFSTFAPGTPFDSQYRNLPIENVAYYQIGYNAYCAKSGTCAPAPVRAIPERYATP